MDEEHLKGERRAEEVAGEVRGYIKSEVLAIVSDGHTAEVAERLTAELAAQRAGQVSCDVRQSLGRG